MQIQHQFQDREVSTLYRESLVAPKNKHAKGGLRVTPQPIPSVSEIVVGDYLVSLLFEAKMNNEAYCLKNALRQAKIAYFKQDSAVLAMPMMELTRESVLKMRLNPTTRNLAKAVFRVVDGKRSPAFEALFGGLK